MMNQQAIFDTTDQYKQENVTLKRQLAEAKQQLKQVQQDQDDQVMSLLQSQTTSSQHQVQQQTALLQQLQKMKDNYLRAQVQLSDAQQQIVSMQDNSKQVKLLMEQHQQQLQEHQITKQKLEVWMKENESLKEKLTIVNNHDEKISKQYENSQSIINCLQNKLISMAILHDQQQQAQLQNLDSVSVIVASYLNDSKQLTDDMYSMNTFLQIQFSQLQQQYELNLNEAQSMNSKILAQNQQLKQLEHTKQQQNDQLVKNSQQLSTLKEKNNQNRTTILQYKQRINSELLVTKQSIQQLIGQVKLTQKNFILIPNKQQIEVILKNSLNKNENQIEINNQNQNSLICDESQSIINLKIAEKHISSLSADESEQITNPIIDESLQQNQTESKINGVIQKYYSVLSVVNNQYICQLCNEKLYKYNYLQHFQKHSITFDENKQTQIQTIISLKQFIQNTYANEDYEDECKLCGMITSGLYYHVQKWHGVDIEKQYNDYLKADNSDKSYLITANYFHQSQNTLAYKKFATIKQGLLYCNLCNNKICSNYFLQHINKLHNLEYDSCSNEFKINCVLQNEVKQQISVQYSPLKQFITEQYCTSNGKCKLCGSAMDDQHLTKIHAINIKQQYDDFISTTDESKKQRILNYSNYVKIVGLYQLVISKYISMQNSVPFCTICNNAYSTLNCLCLHIYNKHKAEYSNLKLELALIKSKK